MPREKIKISEGNHTPKFLLASASASFATIIAPVAMCLYILFQGSSILPNGTPDNDPFRAAGILLFLMPITFIILLALWYLISRGLFYLNVLTRKSLFLFCLCGSVLIGGIFAIDGYRMFGMMDAIYSFLIFFIGTFVTLGLGWLVWWPVGFYGHNNEIKSDGLINSGC